MEPISAVVTTYNNAATLDACLASLAFADEVLVLDSHSTDATLDIAQRHGARVHQHAFMGYGRQKQHAVELAAHRWVLLLDADEMVSAALAEEIRAVLDRTGAVAGFEIPRNERLFWRMNHAGVRHNHYLRLFDRTRGALSDMPVHAAPKVDGPIGRLRAPFYHFGEKDVHTKVDKVNAYSTGLVADKVATGRTPSPWVMVVYPPLAFVRGYIVKRGFMDGWAGFIGAVIMAFYAFLKYAKLYELRRQQRYGDSLLPPGAPRQATSYLRPEGRDPPKAPAPAD